jgi:phosphoglucomutase
LGCDAGIVLTASHNPKEYNGYKVYWNDGGQLVPPHDKGVISEVRNVKIDEISFDFDQNLVVYLNDEVERTYLDKLKTLALSHEGKNDLKIVFTALHGTTLHLLPQTLKENGFTQVQTVAVQDVPDGNFPTVKSPNPEEAEALDMAVKQAEQTGADLVIGCDPDGDRVGIAVRNTQGQMELLNGNQTASLLVDYVLKMRKQQGTLPQNAFIAETVVTTDLIEKIGDHYGIPTKKCLTGFKWIAELIRLGEGKETYIVGGEESYGYLIGDFVRDKDAISAALIISEAAAHAKAKGSSLYQELIDLYVRHGFYLEHLISITKKGKAGLEEIQAMIEGFRKNPPRMLGGSEVLEILDYKTSVATNLETEATRKIGLPSSNFIQFITKAGDRITARPSGTEPKIKFYFSVKSDLSAKEDYSETKQILQNKIESMVVDLGLGS